MANFNIDSLDFKGQSCLMKASLLGYVEVVTLLLRFGANPKLINQRWETALTLACM